MLPPRHDDAAFALLMRRAFLRRYVSIITPASPPLLMLISLFTPRIRHASLPLLHADIYAILLFATLLAHYFLSIFCLCMRYLSSHYFFAITPCAVTFSSFIIDYHNTPPAAFTPSSIARRHLPPSSPRFFVATAFAAFAAISPSPSPPA